MIFGYKMEAAREIENLLGQWQGDLPSDAMSTQRQALATYINELLLNDFNRLVQLLYRIDVDEKKLKQLLQQHPTTDAAELISDLLIERQLQKQKFRASFRSNESNSDEEKW